MAEQNFSPFGSCPAKSSSVLVAATAATSSSFSSSLSIDGRAEI